MGKRTERRMNGQVENIMFPPSLDLRRQKKHHAQSVELDTVILRRIQWRSRRRRGNKKLCCRKEAARCFVSVSS